jgi:hypothetical protein
LARPVLSARGMTRSLTSFTVTFLGSISLVGCVHSKPAPDCQPGDKDCATSTGGKADGWDSTNDPGQLSSQLEYHLDKLPATGTRTTPFWKDTYPEAVGRAEAAWADTYWPASGGSHNNRWMGANVKSPLEKYDAAFNSAPGCDTQPPVSGANTKPLWDTYNACAGPAAQWQTENYESIGLMHNGIDDDNDGTIDAFGSSGTIDGVAGWWGSCHAWTPASMVVPEPQHAVDFNGVHFEVGDIKALLQNVYDQTDAVMLGGRCNGKEIHDIHASANDPCTNVNPGAMHVILANFLGITNAPLIENRVPAEQVWNQPVVGYNVDSQTKITATAANTCVGATGDTWTYNTAAQDLYEVRTTVSYVFEGSASTTPLGFKNNISTDSYHYVLEVDSDNKVIGGRYCTDSVDSHPNFLWAPTAGGGHFPSNPNVDPGSVDQLLRMSVAVQ